jgi:D-alanine--poly(phosphoribitol) ligase subunit 2
MEQEIILILNDICGAEPGELEPDLDLFENGLLDSFGVVQLLVKLEERFGAAPDIESFTREEIATPALIAGIMGKLL